MCTRRPDATPNTSLKLESFSYVQHTGRESSTAQSALAHWDENDWNHLKTTANIISVVFMFPVRFFQCSTKSCCISSQRGRLCMRKHVSFSSSFCSGLLSFTRSVLFIVLLFSLQHYDLVHQRGCAASAFGHIIRALCFALYQHQNMFEPWVGCLRCTTQRSIVTPALLFLSCLGGGSHAKILTMWIQMRRNNRKQRRRRN